MSQLSWRLALTLATAALSLTLTQAPASGPQEGGKPPSRDPQIGQSFRVPYRLTDTNHFLVRVRINGKGPFNFLVDSGAPALFVSTESAKQVGLKPGQDQFWTPIDRLDLEGGARLDHVKARVEDPFQLVGMNALGLPGITIDGILGFTILARFQLEIDPTQDRMTWTRLDYEPRDLPVPEHKPGEQKGGPPEVQAMNALGPIAKGLAFLIGRQPEEQRHPRGFLGLEWFQELTGDRSQVYVRRVLPGSAAAKAGLEPGDLILRIKGQPIDGIRAARRTLGELEPGAKVPLFIRRSRAAGSRELNLGLTAGDGL
jgi:Aspartyl protease/PDZ domain